MMRTLIHESFIRIILPAAYCFQIWQLPKYKYSIDKLHIHKVIQLIGYALL
jgi:hypothetical protein